MFGSRAVRGVHIQPHVCVLLLMQQRKAKHDCPCRIVQVSAGLRRQEWLRA